MNSFKQKILFFLKHPLVSGTLILTVTGLISRLIGFFYRIYLSRLFGEEGMGIYQLISPVIALSFSLCAAGYQTAVSKLSAEISATAATRYGADTRRPLWISLLVSLPLSMACTGVTYAFATPIGEFVLHEPRTIPLLKIIAFSFPFVGVHACINGWFYGMKKAGLPSIAQLVEQLTRVGCVYLLTYKDLSAGVTPNISVAVMGLSIGECVSMTFAVITFLPFMSRRGKARPGKSIDLRNYRTMAHNLLATALPLTANRLVLTFLGSAENVAIPEMLRRHGYNTETALSVYGVLTGMALPLVFFPNALTGSLAVMLLPLISESFCLKEYRKMILLTRRTLKYCGLMGLLCMSVFVFLGRFLGKFLFHSLMAGECIRTLGFICPFLYLDTTLSAILQGLGKSSKIFLINICSLGIRLAFVFYFVPLYGIKGYLWGMLAGQLLLSALYLHCLIISFRACRTDRNEI